MEKINIESPYEIFWEIKPYEAINGYVNMNNGRIMDFEINVGDEFEDGFEIKLLSEMANKNIGMPLNDLFKLYDALNELQNYVIMELGDIKDELMP